MTKLDIATDHAPPPRVTHTVGDRDVLIRFSRKPSESVRRALKGAGFLWSPRSAHWAAPRTGETEALARSLGPQLPRDTILQGDCTEVMQGLPAGSIDLVVTDPPYLVKYKDRSGRSVRNDTEGDWLVPAFAEIYRLLKRDSFCISFYGWNTVDAFMQAWRAADFRPAGHIVWPKGYASSRHYLERCHEQAYLLAKGRPPVPRAPIADVQPWRYTGNRLHPTQKSVDVLSPLIEAFSPPGGVVLDPFAGSGSTALAAKCLGRAYLGIEIDPALVEIATQRLD